MVRHRRQPWQMTGLALDAGCYDIGYRDENWFRPGECGFIPPIDALKGKTKEDMERELPHGFDAYYRDNANRKPGDDGFLAPSQGLIGSPLFGWAMSAD